MHERPSTDWLGESLLETTSGKTVQKKVNYLAVHMQRQMQEHQLAMYNTHQVFEGLLQHLDPLCETFREAFAIRAFNQAQTYQDWPEMSRPIYNAQSIHHQIDPDRSVAILNVLWHAISFTTRGNTKP